MANMFCKSGNCQQDMIQFNTVWSLEVPIEHSMEVPMIKKNWTELASQVSANPRIFP